MSSRKKRASGKKVEVFFLGKQDKKKKEKNEIWWRKEGDGEGEKRWTKKRRWTTKGQKEINIGIETKKERKETEKKEKRNNKEILETKEIQKK